MTTAADTSFNPSADPQNGDVSLRDAITAANALGGSGGSVEIDFHIHPGNGTNNEGKCVCRQERHSKLVESRTRRLRLGQ